MIDLQKQWNSYYLPIISLISIILVQYSCRSSTERTTVQSIDKPIYCFNPKTSDIEWYSKGSKAPKLKGLEGIDFKISTEFPEAQEYFNQGMMLAYGFNHAEAARSFYEVTRIDSNCAMGYWGFAYVLGPNYNGGMEEGNFQRAYEASVKALSLTNLCTEIEKELINAIARRYAKDPPIDRKPLDIAYYESMKKAYQKYPLNPDIGALYAESLMDLHPWDLYDKKTKEPKEWTPELLSILDHLMKINPNHPGAHHYYIHAVEASLTPETGLLSAKFLETKVPGSGHLVHMPSHIYINTGDYHLGSLSNIKAVEVDSNYITTCHAQGAYPLAYYLHNYHFLAATSTLEGNKKWAWLAAQKVQSNTAKDVMRLPGWGTLQHYYTIPWYLAVKFSMWDTLLNLQLSDTDLVYPKAVAHYGRGMAWIGKSNLELAEKELQHLIEISKDTTLNALTIWGINTTSDLVKIAVNVLTAEIAANKKDYHNAIQLLKEAVDMEDNLNYDEPPDWFFSVRHHLGAILIADGQFAEAEKIYRRDLQIWKKNGWALKGLYNALALQHKNSEAQLIQKEFEKAWKYSDIKIESSSPL